MKHPLEYETMKRDLRTLLEMAADTADGRLRVAEIRERYGLVRPASVGEPNR